MESCKVLIGPGKSWNLETSYRKSEKVNKGHTLSRTKEKKNAVILKSLSLQFENNFSVIGYGNLISQESFGIHGLDRVETS